MLIHLTQINTVVTYPLSQKIPSLPDIDKIFFKYLPLLLFDGSMHIITIMRGLQIKENYTTAIPKELEERRVIQGVKKKIYLISNTFVILLNGWIFNLVVLLKMVKVLFLKKNVIIIRK